MPWKAIAVTETELASFNRAFRREAKFYAETSVEQVAVEILHDLGFKVSTSGEVGLSEHDDADHLGYARRENRILLTKDKDFLDDRKFPYQQSPGIVVLDIDPVTQESLADALYVLKVVIRPYREIWQGSKILISRDRHVTIWQKEHDTGRWQRTRYRLSKK